MLVDAAPCLDQHSDPGAIQEADLLQVEDQLVEAAVNQLGQNGLDLRAGGQVDLPDALDQGMVDVALDREVELHHRHRFLVMKRCANSPTWWAHGSGGDGSGTATGRSTRTRRDLRRGTGTLL